MKILIYYSTITGNTKRLAEFLQSRLRAEKHETKCIRLSHSTSPDADENEAADLYVLAFWCRRSSIDDISRGFLEKLCGKKILAVGTIGGIADGDYGRRVEEAVRQLISKDNICCGAFVCQGSVNMERIEKRRALPETDKHFVNDEKYQRYLTNIGRPTEEDLEGIWEKISAAIR